MSRLHNYLIKGRWLGGAIAPIFLIFLLSSCNRSEPAPARSEGPGEGVSQAFFNEDCCTPGEHLACQDGIWCNGEEQCDCWGSCEVGPPVNCDDGDHCTDDTCIDDRIDPAGEGYGLGHCRHVCVPSITCICPECRRPSDCDDGNECTIDDCNEDSVCVYSDVNCDDGDVCTTETCNPATGCVYTPVPDCCLSDDDCDDGITCTDDVCDTDSHVCRYNLMDGYCLIGGVCYTDGTLNPANECESCQYLLQTDRWTGLPAGSPCDDGLFCTEDQACDGDGRCVGVGNPCDDDGVICTDTVCNEATDSCLHPIADGYCYIGGVCYSDGDVNPANTCEKCSSPDSKTSWTPVPAGSPCDDGLFCTLTDTCDAAGACTGSGDPCIDGSVCTHDICDEASDSCDHSTIDCSDDNPCTDDTCVDPLGCVHSHSPVGTPCTDDANACTNDICDGAGSCTHPPVTCDDSNVCTSDSCDSLTGCVFTPLLRGTPCSGASTQCWFAQCDGAGVCGFANTGAACDPGLGVCFSGTCDDRGVCVAQPLTPVNDQCNGSPMPSSGANHWTASGDTTCASNDYSGACGGTGGHDVVWSLTLTSDGGYTMYGYSATLSGPFDTVLYDRTNCAGIGSRHCNNNCVGNDWVTCPASWFNSGYYINPLPANSSRTSYFIVDGVNAGTFGSYTLDVDKFQYRNSDPCDQIPGDPDVFYGVDVTAGGTWRSNLESYPTYWNSIICGANNPATQCGQVAVLPDGTRHDFESRLVGPGCWHDERIAWSSRWWDRCYGWRNWCEYGDWPANAWFQILPTSRTRYRIRLNERGTANAFDGVISLWRMTDPNVCMYITAMGCTSKPGVARNANTGWMCLQPGNRYMIGISKRVRGDPGVNYEIIVETGGGC